MRGQTGAAGAVTSPAGTRLLRSRTPDRPAIQRRLECSTRHPDTNQALDAPLLGNGDVGVAILGRPNAMTFILSKNEFWSLSDGAVKAMARMNLAIGGLNGATYRMQQDISRGEVIGTFTLAGNTLQTTSWMQATDTTTNLFVTRFQYTGSSSQAATVSFSPGNGNAFPVSRGSAAT
jgi:alpha-L-fucosidase 2